MGSKNERHEEKWGEKVTFLLIFLSYFPLVPSPLNPAGGVLTKIYYKAQPPHEVCAPYHSTAAVTVSRWLCCPFSHSKILSNNHKKVKVSLHHHFSVVELWEHPILLDFTMQVQLWSKTLLKHGKWLSLLVFVGQISPGIWLKPLMRGQEPTVPGFALFFFF